MLDERGFGSIEFIFITLIVMILLVGLSNLVNSETGQMQTGDIAQTKMTGEKMAEIVNTVYRNGAGYTISMAVPTSMTVFVNNPAGYLTVLSTSTGANMSIKIIPKNIQTITLSSGNVYNVTQKANGTIMFTPL